ncbi:superoxide dismutase [Ranunculus cassubicifolius]
MLGAPATSTSLSCALSSFKGFTGNLEPSGIFLLQRNTERKCAQKASKSVITAHFELKPPPYPMNSLEPHMSRETLEYHWGNHHRGYVENLNRQIAGTELDGMELEDIILLTYNRGDPLPAFNNAAQIWNHEFFWESMKPGGGGKPSGDLLDLIERDFGSYNEFMKEFKSAASAQFGSGWVWLAYKANRLDVGNAINPRPSEEDKKLVIVKSPNAVNPLVWDYSPLLALDVWEHSYYIDYQNRKVDYISTFMEKFISWEMVSERLEMAKARAIERENAEDGTISEEEKTSDDEALGMYVDSESEESETE